MLTLAFALACSRKSGSAPAPPVEPPPVSPAGDAVAWWLTTGGGNALLQQQASLAFGTGTNTFPVIDVDSTQRFQSMDGFGYTLTGGSAQLINAMSASSGAALLQELFGTGGDAIGVSYLRISIGASDLSAAPFTYNELQAGQIDTLQQQFSIAAENADLVPLLKQIVQIQPGIKILGSPWTAPRWMKSNGSYIGGSLLPQYYRAYARYFVKYIQAMQAEGIRIDAVTVQNEPQHGGNNPSMVMSATEQADFVKNHLGPMFAAAGITTKIIVWDHNADNPGYPIQVLNDPAAKAYIDGSAFHLYAGNISALTQVHNAHPDRNVYFTEQWIGGPGNFGGDLKWHIENLMGGAPRNWSRNVLEWNLAADANYGPHTDQGGCSTCLGALTISGNSVLRNTAYYVVAHSSRFVPQGSVRVQSSIVTGLPNVAYTTPAGKKVLLVLNSGGTPRSFNIRQGGRQVTALLEGGAVGTFVW
ncbi:glucosylceramidase [Flaviaesturariibacter flavus]|uniref:Glucosylceramidase n=1 Tax=Flaviaesturariibacter flavus TaxID=2502780 RepID=A0A4R1BC56_9BACT|nr:glucosylceramidase [Flaviaesturariibacter flavus]